MKYGKFSIFLLAALCWACVPKSDVPTPSAGNADFSRVVTLGGHVMAGYQDGALYREGQQNSLGALLAQQLSEAQNFDFAQPEMPDGEGLGLNFKFWDTPFQTRSQMGDRVDC
ncbi:MAG: hypothetical protein AAF570_10490, partial [Bacteroidota bacterium]